MNPKEDMLFLCVSCSTVSKMFADSRIEVRRYRRMDINGFNGVLEKLSFDLEPTTACVAGAYQMILQLNG